jgi:hypothetical protein
LGALQTGQSRILANGFVIASPKPGGQGSSHSLHLKIVFCFAEIGVLALKGLKLLS